MRFVDYNGTGRLDPQDIATSVAVEEARREENSSPKPEGTPLASNAGCATMAAFMAFPILIILLAL